MAKRSQTPDDFDSPWKDALHAYLPFFLTFFFPDVHADIDWTKGYESLDKEFQQLIRKAKIGKRLADKLFKVWLNTGEERWLLIHVEIQGDYEKEFPERMFEYHVAIRKMYNHKAVGLAVLCDDNTDWKPTRYEYDQWGCGVSFRYRIAKLLDYRDRLDGLESSENPIAMVVIAHLKTLETRKDPLSRKEWKLRLVKGLYRSHWAKEDIQQLFRVIDWVMNLPDELDESFWREFRDFEGERQVEYVTSVERIGIKKGIVECVAVDLSVKFGPSGRKLLPQVQALKVDELRKFMKFVKRARTIDEVREYLK